MAAKGGTKGHKKGTRRKKGPGCRLEQGGRHLLGDPAETGYTKGTRHVRRPFEAKLAS